MDRIKIVTIGSDPEFFVKRGDLFFPPMGLTNGSKHTPELIDSEGFYLQRDNLCLEGNIPPAKDRTEFIRNIKKLKKLISKRISLYGLTLVCVDSAPFKPRFLRTPEAHEFGCEPYMVAWNGDRKGFQAENLGRQIRRPAGFHIHIGYNLLTKDYTKSYMDSVITQLFDMFVTTPARKYYYDSFRNNSYGELGAYRTTSYGVECRALGSFFLQDQYLGWVYNQTMKIENYLNNCTDENLSTLRRTYTGSYYNSSLSAGKVRDTLYTLLGINLKAQLIPGTKEHAINETSYSYYR